MQTDSVIYMAYDISYFIKSETHSLLHSHSLKPGQHFIIIIGSSFFFSFLVVHKIMAWLIHNGVLDSMKYSLLINQFPEGGKIYKTMNV